MLLQRATVLSLSNSHINRYCHRLRFDCSPHRQSVHGHDYIYSIYNNDHLYSTITSTASTVSSSKTTSKATSTTTSKTSSATSIPAIRSHDRATFLWPLLFSGHYLSPATFSPGLPFSGCY